MKLQEVVGSYTIYCDMDGVLVDFAGGLSQLIAQQPDEIRQQFDISPNDVYKSHHDKKIRNNMWKFIRFYTKRGGRLWYQLPPMKDAARLWDFITDHEKTEILTATGDPVMNARQQKIEWVPRHLHPSNVKINTVQTAKEKAQFAAPDHILIDDQPKAINPWVAAGGIGILHTSANDTIRKLKNLGI